MAGNQHHNRWLGAAPATDWDTPSIIISTGAIAHLNQSGDSWNIGGGLARALEMSKNNNPLKTHDQRHTATFSVNAQLDLNGRMLQHLIAAMYGASTDSPAEATGGQGDYEHVIQLSSATSKVVTLAGLLESDKLAEAPTGQPTSMTISGNQNDPIRVSITGVASQRLTDYEGSPTNTVAEISAMTYPTPDLAFANAKTNLWCRINAQASGALSGSDNVKIESFSYTVSRNPELSYVFDTTSTGICQAPKYPGAFSEHSLTLTFDRLDDSFFDVVSSFQSATAYKFHIFTDGSQIGSGDNASFGLWLPKGQCITPVDTTSSQGSQMKPSITFNLLEASAAPTGFPTGTILAAIGLTTTTSVDLA